MNIYSDIELEKDIKILQSVFNKYVQFFIACDNKFTETHCKYKHRLKFINNQFNIIFFYKNIF